MTERPFTIEIPTRASAGQVIGCTATLWRVLAWDLGEKYDAYMRPEHGDDWLEELRQARMAAPSPKDLYKHPLKLHDVSFVLWEPAQHSNSPLRGCLPAGVGIYDLMDKVRKQRNADAHDAPEPTLELLDEYAAVVEQLAALAQLPLVEECVRLRQRIVELQHGVEEEPVDLAQLLQEKRTFQTEAAVKAAEAAQLLGRLKEASTEKRGLLAELEAAQAAKALADEQAAMAQGELERQYAELRRTRSDVDVAGLSPGDPWPLPPEGRNLRLLSYVLDLYDPSETDLLSNTLGHVAVAAAERWRALLPHGGTVVLTEAGHGVATIGATWTYLGSLDSSPQ